MQFHPPLPRSPRDMQFQSRPCLVRHATRFHPSPPRPPRDAQFQSPLPRPPRDMQPQPPPTHRARPPPEPPPSLCGRTTSANKITNTRLLPIPHWQKSTSRLHFPRSHQRVSRFCHSAIGRTCSLVMHAAAQHSPLVRNACGQCDTACASVMHAAARHNLRVRNARGQRDITCSFAKHTTARAATWESKQRQEVRAIRENELSIGE